LLSAFMFEDVMARVIPTAWCKTPGCGVMSRGAWFEQAMELNQPDMRKPLVASRPKEKGAHLPYLFLNSTWVETGERAIASEVLIEHARFPTARDQLRYAGGDPPTSTASHNAARFPYVNAIGSLRTPPKLCPKLGQKSDPEDQPDPPIETDKKKWRGCGHLADGGYFDNSGGHTTADVLRALAALLREDDEDSTTILGTTRKAWLRANLVPQVIMIRNGVEQKAQFDCDPTDPSRPRCDGRFKLLTDLLGPPVTAFNAIGTGANGRVAESLLNHEALAVRPPLKTPNEKYKPVATVDLTREGVLFPLGWYLSLSAQCGMERQARKLDRYAGICLAGDAKCTATLGKSSQPRPECKALDEIADANAKSGPPAQ
ncbi:MAG TPA: hypothetical protein VD867_12880, partial [Burkholderiales bacterium]|nr:hypothetical protein [Burkholderiales bacterium]